MNNVIRNVLLGGLLCLSVPLSAQVPQDLIDKAKAGRRFKRNRVRPRNILEQEPVL